MILVQIFEGDLGINQAEDRKGHSKQGSSRGRSLKM